MIRGARQLAVLMTVLLPWTLAGAHPQIDDSELDADRARLLGALTFTRLAARFDGVPARDAFRAVSRAVGVPVRGRYADDRIGHGIDPMFPITFTVADETALDVLELILEQCADFEPCTWQLRRGFVEVGTKKRLAAPSARERRTYPIRDLLLEAPNYKPQTYESVTRFNELPYATAALTRPSETGRKRPEELAVELVQGVVELVEPGNWEYGQLAEEEEDVRPEQYVGSVSRTAPPSASSPRWRSGPRKIARIRFWRDRFLIDAPDFIHRQVNGYPPPIAPPPLSAEDRALRSEAASTVGATIVVIANDARPHRSARDRAPVDAHRIIPGGPR